MPLSKTDSTRKLLDNVQQPKYRWQLSCTSSWLEYIFSPDKPSIQNRMLLVVFQFGIPLKHVTTPVIKCKYSLFRDNSYLLCYSIRTEFMTHHNVLIILKKKTGYFVYVESEGGNYSKKIWIIFVFYFDGIFLSQFSRLYMINHKTFPQT